MAGNHKEAAIEIAIRNGAPPEARSYIWTELALGDETFHGAQFAGHGEPYITVQFSQATTHGTLSVGWNAEARRGVWRFEPNEA